MTLDEAIIHAEEVSEENERLCEQIHPALQWKDYGKCASEHRQLAEWLKDYKRLKEQEPKSPCDVCRYNPPGSGDGKPCTMCPAESEVNNG